MAGTVLGARASIVNKAKFSLYEFTLMHTNTFSLLIFPRSLQSGSSLILSKYESEEKVINFSKCGREILFLS